MTVFWDVVPRSLVEVYPLSEVLTTSIIRVIMPMMKTVPVRTCKMSVYLYEITQCHIQDCCHLCITHFLTVYIFHQASSPFLPLTNALHTSLFSSFWRAHTMQSLLSYTFFCCMCNSTLFHKTSIFMCPCSPFLYQTRVKSMFNMLHLIKMYKHTDHWCGSFYCSKG
jgi:hypothetical protein